MTTARLTAKNVYDAKSADLTIRKKSVTFREVRAMRAVRALRSMRVETTQRLAKMAEDLKRWISQRVGRSEDQKQGESLTPRMTREQTLRQRLMVDLPRQRPDGPRQSRGHSI
jgi:hypothetical protein